MLTRETEYNFLHASKGGNDECYTPREGVEILLPYMEKFRDKIIWCPFDTIESEFVKIFACNGFKVRYSDVIYGENFFTYEPPEWDVIISNPPFTNKRGIFKRALSFNKPFALLMTAAWLNDKAPCQLFKDKGLQLLIPTERMRFKNQTQKRINFKSIYYCRDFLPKNLIITDFSTSNDVGEKAP